VIAGTGTLQAALKAQAATLGIAERVHFIGWRTDVQALMAQFEVFLAPSLWEGFGLVFLEAMGQARPVISTRVSSIPEVVEDGVTGLLVPPCDGQAIAGVLERLLNDPACGQRMGEAGRTRLAQVFTPERMIAQTIDVYRSL
jgi:glycosyltransferase involved in cell wall biosynthesis